MRVEKSVSSQEMLKNSISAAENTKRNSANEKTCGKREGSLKSINAAELNIAGCDKIEQEKEKARNMVMGLIKNAFGSDLKIDDEVNERTRHIEDLNKENMEYSKKLEDIENEGEALKEEYGITDESQEQKDLELLRKQRASFKNTGIRLSDEEQERIAQINEDGKTDYQEAMLKLDSNASEIKSEMAENNKLIIEENSIIRGIAIERLKTHEMVDVQKQADKILEAANSGIKGIIMEEVKNNTDEESEVLKEEAEKKKAEQEELERRTKKQDKRDGELEDLYDLNRTLENINTKEKETNLDDVKKSLNQVVNELKLTASDLSGLLVDEQA